MVVVKMLKAQGIDQTGIFRIAPVNAQLEVVPEFRGIAVDKQTETDARSALEHSLNRPRQITETDDKSQRSQTQRARHVVLPGVGKSATFSKPGGRLLWRLRKEFH